MCSSCNAAAIDWTHGGYQAGCRGCEVRAVAGAPKRVREQRYAQVAHADGESAMQAYRADVMAEYRRIDALRSGA